MVAYIIAQVDVTDIDQYKQYAARTPAVVAAHGGRFIARGGRTVVLEGEADNRRVVVIEFPSLERAEAFYNSPEYQEAKALRIGAADGRFIAVEGV
ncbi:MAG: DUF1330 domain-containing protein [Inquilinus sp.]|nr:DUF1330 domain-containing protein [Inquilinus sp.]